MTNQNPVDRRLAVESSNRTSQEVEHLQAELPQDFVFPTCDEKDIPIQSAAEARLDGDASQLIVTAGATAHSVQVHHQGIPDLRSHGESAESVAVNLSQDLSREIDDAADDLHREPLQRALDDVNASIEQGA